MSDSRIESCRRTARAIQDASGSVASTKALVGFDGFVDEIITVVDKRYGDGAYDPVKTISDFAQKVRAAAGASTNYELVVKQRKLGGNGPIMANALATFGLDVTYVGNLGHPAIDPVFDEFAARARIISLAPPGQTAALEFEDGKLMLGKHAALGEVDWDALVGRIGRPGISALFAESSLVGMVNWTMLPHLSEIWERLIDEVLPNLPAAARPTLFVDLADPEKRTHEDITAALRLVSRLQEHAEVVLGLNLKESTEVGEALGFHAVADPESAIEEAAASIRRELGLGCVVIHPRGGAAAATAAGSARVAGPFVEHPLISTGAGDHFNAGFCLGRVLGLDLVGCLYAGVATSGYYVRTARSPSLAQLAGFLADLP